MTRPVCLRNQSALMLSLCWLVLMGCASDGASSKVQVYAASSLTEVFTALEAAFEEENPNTDVVLNFAGSQILRLQIEQGAAAHVVATANVDHMQALQTGGHLASHRVFARNELVLIVPDENPAGIHRFEDLPRAQRWVMGTEGVPIGQYGRAILGKVGPDFQARVMSGVVSYENNVRLIRTKVQLGEADAGLVYRTDVLNVPGIKVIEVPPRFSVAAAYGMGVTSAGASRSLTGQWTTFVASAPGQAILKQHGFGTP